MNRIPTALFLALASVAPAMAAPLRIDGRADEAAWAGARVFRDFVVVEPFTLVAPSHPTEVRMLATPEGLAFAFRCTQPPGVPRQRERTPRDADAPGDRVNVFIDFNADAQVAYNFTLALSGAVQDATITNENNWSPDWDGEWSHAVSEDEQGWTAEILLPWGIAAMRDSEAPQRTVAVMFDRVLGTTAERSGFPAASFMRPRFVSEFHRVEVAQFQRAVLDWFPYATVQHDVIDGRVETKGGLDVFWKPSGDFQLTAALNPDFGQVEADELVVNFDAVETFFSDRRPFFTENQSIFDLRTPDEGQLIYTRRIGGPRDDDPGRAADLDAAVKLNGTAGGFAYGTLAALEADHADDLGSAFLAQRVVHPGETFDVGWLGTFTDRPFLDRTAQVQAVDATWRPTATVALEAQVIGSRIDDDGRTRDGRGAWFRLDLTPSAALRHELEVTHFGRALNFNDIGFQRRASLNELEWTSQLQQSEFPAEAALRGINWIGEIQYRTNDRGDRLPVVAKPVVQWQFRDGGALTLETEFESAGWDDLISRGNGLVRFAPRRYLGLEYLMPRIGDVQLELEGGTFEEGLSQPAHYAEFEVTWFAGERLNLDAYGSWVASPDWLIWERDRLFGRYSRDQGLAGFNANWFPATGHELRAKVQWVGIDARDPESLRLSPDGRLRAATDPLDDFSVNSFGAQLRYRWTFAPQSDLYVVWSRGGFTERRGEEDDLFDLLGDAASLRDDDQVLVKLRYRL